MPQKKLHDSGCLFFEASCASFCWLVKLHRENTRREESKYLECENRQLGLIAIATYIFKPPTEKFKIGR